jgi:hypothetical protein
MTSIEDGKILLPPPKPLHLEEQTYQPSDGGIYSSVRSSEPLFHISPQVVVVPSRQRAASDDSLFSPMGAPSAIPRPLFNEKLRVNEPLPRESNDHKKSFAARRPPSYEGTGYRHEISVLDLHSKTTGVVKTSNIDQVAKTKAQAPSRLPTPTRIQPVSYSGQPKATAAITRDNGTMPRPAAVPWLGADAPPAVPAKNPNRYNSARGNATANQLTREEHVGVMRIVSKENIRAALGGTSPDVSTEDLNEGSIPPVPSRMGSPQVLQTYNTHMFPRKDQCNGMPRGK